VAVDETSSRGLEVSVLDDGCGMAPPDLAAALQFGGSSRFGDRRGLGRFGMGLPNSSLSQARRVEVYSWRDAGPVVGAHLDSDEIAEGRCSDLERPSERDLPEGFGAATPSGTLVVWRRCDRLSERRPAGLRSELRSELGAMFRYFIWDGVKICVNGERCAPLDPLLLDRRSPHHGASRFGEPTELELRGPDGQAGLVVVTYSELPVHAWHTLSNAEKRRMGVTKGGGVHIVRAQREIDHGWFFMGEKRRENYDDWWRVEVRFEPGLDEAFGITNTKQHVRPARWLTDALTREIEPVGRALNARVRRAHQTMKVRERFAASERAAAAVEGRMPPLSYPGAAPDDDLSQRLSALYPDLFCAPESPDVRLVEDDLGDGGVFDLRLAPRRLVVVLNTAHPFYRRAYAPLAEATDPTAVERRASLELLLVSLARAEAAGGGLARAGHRAWAEVLGEMVRP
jgi:hypothetical protein